VDLVKITDVNVHDLGMGKSIYSKEQMEDFARFQDSQNTRRAYLTKTAENEKESARTTARCHVSLEKLSKNYSRCENEPSQATRVASPLPHPPSIGGFWWRVFHVVEQNKLRKHAGKICHCQRRVLGERAG
jgi:hypothetical protein